MVTTDAHAVNATASSHLSTSPVPVQTHNEVMARMHCGVDTLVDIHPPSGDAKLALQLSKNELGETSRKQNVG